MTAGFRVAGSVTPPGDKSISHRALLLAALADGPSRIRGILPSADVQATAAALRALGASIPPLSADFVVEGRGPAALRSPAHPLDCGNSGTTARLLAGVLAALPGVEARLEGDESLCRRPMRRVAAPLGAMGAQLVFEGAPGHDGLPLRVVGGTLRPLVFDSPHASAQVKSAVLLAGLLAGVEVTVAEPERSRDHTERMLAARGVRVEVDGPTVRLPAGQRLRPLDTEVPGDPSSAMFWAALAALASTGELRVEGVALNPTRTGGFDLLRRMGAAVSLLDQRDAGGEPVGTVVVAPGALRAIDVRGGDIPRAIDELPMLACLAARAQGTTVVRDAQELRVKESDRIRAVVANLRAIGVQADELPDGFAVTGGTHPLAGTVVTHGDHRLAMAFGVLAALPGNALALDDPGCVAVSYPGFWEELTRLTGASVRTAVRKSVAPTAPPAPLVIAIDGPAASGKSSTAQWVARELGVHHVDSGAFYRAVAWLGGESGIAPAEWTAAQLLAEAHRVGRRLTERSVLPVIDGLDRDEALRGGAVTAAVSRVAQMPAVRAWVNDQVRAAGAETDVVVDGRDIGTAVFPHAGLKVFLVADPWERARRRLLQRLGRRPSDVEIAEETEALVARDAQDAAQSVPARDAVTIDTTTVTQAEQVERIVALARAARRRRRDDADA
jgi:3-phosphoshikimate 1-carboxyvinyltransferase